MEEHNVCQEKVYQSLFRQLSQNIYNYVYFKCGDEMQAKDLVQESFIKLWENCAKVPHSKAKSFLYTVANNAFLNEVAHQKVVLNFAKKSKTVVNEQSPEYLLQEKEFEEKLQTALANLTEAQRVAFLMNRVEGKKYLEIDKLLDISIKAVEKRMSQALASLRKEIHQI